MGVVSPKLAGLRTASIAWGFQQVQPEDFPQGWHVSQPQAQMCRRKEGVPDKGAPRRDTQEAEDVEIICGSKRLLGVERWQDWGGGVSDPAKWSPGAPA